MGQTVSNGKGSQQYPYFQSAGGVTPEQQALAQYTMGQDMVSQGSQFANAGTGMSTMATQGAGVGPAFTRAASLAQSSDANQMAMQKAQQNAQSINNQNIATGQSNMNDLLSLANQTVKSGQ